VEMLSEGVGEARAAADMSEKPVTAPQRERNGLAEVAEDDFQPRIGIEHAADNEADGRNGSLGGEAPRHRQKREIAAAIIGIVGLGDGGVRNAGMKIDRNVERLRSLENAPKAQLIEKRARRQYIDQRVLVIEGWNRVLAEICGR